MVGGTDTFYIMLQHLVSLFMILCSSLHLVHIFSHPLNTITQQELHQGLHHSTYHNCQHCSPESDWGRSEHRSRPPEKEAIESTCMGSDEAEDICSAIDYASGRSVSTATTARSKGASEAVARCQKKKSHWCLERFT